MDFHSDAVFAEPRDGMLVESLTISYHDFLPFASVGEMLDGTTSAIIAVHDDSCGGEDEIADVHAFGGIFAEFFQFFLDIPQFVHHADEPPCTDERILWVGNVGRHEGIENLFCVVGIFP